MSLERRTPLLQLYRISLSGAGGPCQRHIGVQGGCSDAEIWNKIELEKSY